MTTVEGLAVGTLVSPARRINPLRPLLLVSRVLGKHIPVAPAVALAAGAALALRLADAAGVSDDRCAQVPAALAGEDAALALWTSLADHPLRLPVAPVVIGFAETATALGHAVAACIEGADYVHTTRQGMAGRTPSVTFVEHHSHAPEHALFDLPGPGRPLVLVDDELTTGRTALNLVRAVAIRQPLTEVTLLALVDQLGTAGRERLAAEGRAVGVAVQALSLAAVIEPAPAELPEAAPTAAPGPAPGATTLGSDAAPVVAEHAVHVTARGLLDHIALRTFRSDATRIAAGLGEVNGGRTLCIGTGELMYLPMLVAAGLGPGTAFGSTTRSPIAVLDVEGYPVRRRLSFPALDGTGRTDHLYNVMPGQWDRAVILVEDGADATALAALHHEVAVAAGAPVRVVSIAALCT